MFEIVFYDEKVEANFECLPPKIKAKMILLLDMLKLHGNEVSRTYSTAFGEGLYELRAKAEEGIARAFYIFNDNKIIIVLHIFLKKSQKTPKKDLERAKKILKEIKCEK